MERLAAAEPARGVTLAEGGLVWPAELLNVTALGIAVVCQRPFEPGVERLLLLGPLGAARPVRVIHSTLLPGGRYLVGARFDRPLTFIELQALVRPDAIP